jgi:4-amino-4-deoxy-L-arabinose transferase-like glycosyltransferase
MNVVLTLLAICGLIVLAPMALATLLLVVASAIGVARTWREDRRLRRDFERIIGEQVKR